MSKPGMRTKDEAVAPVADWQHIGATLRVIRQLRGYKPGEFANVLGITTPYLHNIEAGRKKLTNEMLSKAAEALAVPQIAIMRPRADQPAVPDIDYKDPHLRRTVVYDTAPTTKVG